MDEYGYSSVGGGHWGKGGGYFALPQHCELEVCRLPDWHQHAYTDRFSSSSFADSESEEELSKRRALLGPARSLPKFRRSGTSSHPALMAPRRHHPPYGTDKRHSHPGERGRKQQCSHSSSDDEVFLEPLRLRALPAPYPRHPPPYPEESFARRHPGMEYYPTESYVLPQDHGHGHYNDDSSLYRPRPRARERHHSMPPPRPRDSSRGREASKGRDPSRGRDLSRGREQSRGRPGHQSRHYTEAVLVEGAPLSSEESSEDGSLRPAASVSEDVDYLYRYGYASSLGSSRPSKTSSGSSSSSHGYRGAMLGRGRVQGSSRGAYPPSRPSSDGWNGATKSRSLPQGGVGVPSHSQPPLPSPAGQRGGGRHHPHHHPLTHTSRPTHPHLHVNHGMPTEPKAQGGGDFSTMSIAEKLHRFMLFVRHENSNRINDIQTIENAITGCHLDLKTLYETEDVGVYQGRHTFSGKLSLSGMFLARAVGQVKRELKHECYKLALQVLRTKTVAEILKQHDIGIEAIRRKFEECSDADTEAAVSEAVVNLASAAPIAVAMETVATTEERWQDFVTYLQGLNPDMGNTISRIELAISGSRCGLERVYSDTTIMDQYQGKPGFQGSLSLGGVLQAQGQGTKKKEAKQRTYDAAYHRFSSLDLPDVLKGVPPQNVEEFKKERSLNVVVKEIRTAEHIKKFELFIDRIKDSSVREGPVTLLDLTANQLQLLITCMYKKTEEQDGVSNLCRLFVGDILISEGEGRQKKEAQADAYSKAYEILISTPVDTLVSESHRLNTEELQGADVQDVVIKGQIKKEESNLPRLRQQFINVEEALSERTSEGMVIVEHQDWVHDRKRHSFCILQNSALMNVMLLKWCTEIETGFFTCRVQLQGEELGRAKAHSRQQARNLASADALFSLYETQPVLRIVSTDQSSSWVTFQQLVERLGGMGEGEFREADEEWNHHLLKLSAATTRPEADDSSSGAADSAGFELSEQQKEEGKRERRLRVVVTRVVQEYQERGDILEELVFAPDLPHSLRRYLTTAVARMGLRGTQCQKDGNIFLTIYFRVRVDKVVAAMRERGVTRTSRFLLVEDRSTLPCHADVAEEIEVASTLTRQDRLAAKMAPRPPRSADAESRDAASGHSLNGSLFEETMEGFVTARSYMISDANASLLPPKVQSTPAPHPLPPTSASPPPDTPAEEVYAKFARAMMASGIGQTLVPMECSTPVSTNILVNPPQSHSLGGNNPGGAPVIKNILISPPKGHGLGVTLSSPIKILTLSSSASSSFPQPDFSASPRMKNRGEQESGSCLDTVSPTSPVGCRPGHGVSGQPSAQHATTSVPAPSQRPKRSSSPPPPALAPSACVAAGHAAPRAGDTVPVCQGPGTASSQHAACTAPQSANPFQDGFLFANPASYTHKNPVDFSQGYAAQPVSYAQGEYAASAGGFYAPVYPPFQGASWHPPAWSCTDPSAPHAIQMSPVARYDGYGNLNANFPKAPDTYTAAVFVENEMAAHTAHGRRWNQFNPV
ncbi:hypothetical protein ACOMHN_023741 [Nucella lapillus]